LARLAERRRLLVGSKPFQRAALRPREPHLLRALALLQRSARGELPADILDQGGIAPLLWDGQAKELAWAVKTDPPIAYARCPDLKLLLDDMLRLAQEAGS
jgi:hypothetical protein